MQCSQQGCSERTCGHQVNHNPKLKQKNKVEKRVMKKKRKKKALS